MPDIELKKIQPNRLNPRLEFSKAGLDELADSIKQVGLLEPIIVRPGDDQYEVVVGERRYRAAQQAGLDLVPVIIRDYTDDEVVELNIIENIHREDLGHIEKGNCCVELLSKFSAKYATKASLAKKIGVDETTVAKWIEAATVVPKEVQQIIAPAEPTTGKIPKGKISGDMAVRISQAIDEPRKQVELAQEIARRGIPKSEARQIITRIAREPEKPVREIFKEAVEEAPIFLPFSKAHADAIVNGIKTQTSRKAKDPRLQPGATVRAQVTHFADLEIADVYRKRLGDFDDEDARREGGYTLDEFKEIWKALHGEWNPNESVYVIRFRLSRVVGEPANSS